MRSGVARQLTPTEIEYRTGDASSGKHGVNEDEPWVSSLEDCRSGRSSAKPSAGELSRKAACARKAADAASSSSEEAGNATEMVGLAPLLRSETSSAASAGSPGSSLSKWGAGADRIVGSRTIDGDTISAPRCWSDLLASPGA
jgi:hypothetical protein